MHVRTPVMIGLIVLLVLLGSAFCYYRVGASQSGIRDQAPGARASGISRAAPGSENAVLVEL
jgi:hypothetical protein